MIQSFGYGAAQGMPASYGYGAAGAVVPPVPARATPTTRPRTIGGATDRNQAAGGPTDRSY